MDKLELLQKRLKNAGKKRRAELLRMLESLERAAEQSASMQYNSKPLDMSVRTPSSNITYATKR